MIRELQEKMIELGTQDLMAAGRSELAAKNLANREADRFEELHARALIATGITVTYDKTRGARPEPAEWSGEQDLEAMHAANPGVDIQPAPGGGFKANTHRLKFPVTPPRPRYVSTGTFTDPGRVDAVFGPIGTPADAARGEDIDQSAIDEPCEACTEDDGHPVPPDDEDKITERAMPATPDRQELEDRLRVIAAIVEDQAPFGTELANFQRRLRFALQAGR